MSGPALAALAVAAFAFTGAFTADASPPRSSALESAFGGSALDGRAPESRNACEHSCEYTAKTCVKKCVEDQKPCLDKCAIDPDADPKNLKPKDQACVKACFDKSRPCQDGCQSRRTTCVRACPG